MPWRLQYADEALDDLDAIRAWLTQPGAGRAARKRLQAVRQAIAGLRDHPLRYPVGDHPDFRERPCAGYRIFYLVYRRNDSEFGEVMIARVFGPRQRREV